MNLPYGSMDKTFDQDLNIGECRAVKRRQHFDWMGGVKNALNKGGQ